MLEKTTYFFPLASIFYLLVFYFSGKSKKVKIKKIMGITKILKNYIKLFEITEGLNLLILAITTIIIFGKKLFGQIESEYVFAELNSTSLIFLGFIIIKFSYAWILISEYETHKMIDEVNNKMNLAKLFKLELVSTISVFIYSIGSSFIFNSIFLMILSGFSFSIILMEVIILLVKFNKE